MENLQITHSSQVKTWEALEKSLSSRLSKYKQNKNSFPYGIATSYGKGLGAHYPII